MVLIELSPNDVLVFDIEDISDAIQSTTAQSCSNTEDDSISLFEVASNWLFRCTISPNTGMMQMNHACITTMELAHSDYDWFTLYQLFLVIFLWDQIVVVADVAHGSRANYFSKLPVTEKAEAVEEHFHGKSGILYKLLSAQYHFSTELMNMHLYHHLQ
jgi:hypothetical protein